MAVENVIEAEAPAGPTSIDFTQLEKLITVKDVAELFEVEPRIVRRESRKGAIPGQIKVLGKMGFDPDVVTSWVPPEGGERISKREDGRRRYRIFLSEAEFATLAEGGYEIVDPRVAAKARRTARKAKAAAGGAATAAEVTDEEDPFGGFEGED